MTENLVSSSGINRFDLSDSYMKALYIQCLKDEGDVWHRPHSWYRFQFLVALTVSDWIKIVCLSKCEWSFRVLACDAYVYVTKGRINRLAVQERKGKHQLNVSSVVLVWCRHYKKVCLLLFFFSIPSMFCFCLFIVAFHPVKLLSLCLLDRGQQGNFTAVFLMWNPKLWTIIIIVW